METLKKRIEEQKKRQETFEKLVVFVNTLLGLKDKIDKIHQIYENGYYYIKRVTKEEIAASYIESIYNIFNIINKRHDDIEKKLGISNKIEIV